MVDKKYLLDSTQMANFVADGFLRFNELVPKALNEAALTLKWTSGAFQGHPVAPRSTKFGAMIRQLGVSFACLKFKGLFRVSSDQTRFMTTKQCILFKRISQQVKYGTPMQLSIFECTLIFSSSIFATTRPGRWAER